MKIFHSSRLRQEVRLNFGICNVPEAKRRKYFKGEEVNFEDYVEMLSKLGSTS